MAIQGNIKIGQQYRFNYPREFVTLPEYTAHCGHSVTVVRKLTQAEAQGAGRERMFRIRATDGWIGDAWASELV